MSKPLIELKFYEPIFAMASHPSESLIAIGLSSGYVFLIKYDGDLLKEHKDSYKVLINKDGYDSNNIEIIWKTRRHKGSVRSLAFDSNGEFLYSIGSDQVLKKSIVKNGKVSNKVKLEDKSLFTKIIKSQTHDFLVLGDEGGSILVLDSNTLELKKKLKSLHEETINDIIQQSPNKYPYRFISVGCTTLVIFDIRKDEPISTSDNQEDEILSTSLVTVEDKDSGVVCGMSDGIITIWNPKNGFLDQLNRIRIAKDETIDCIISSFKNDDSIWCGASNGVIYKVNVKKGKIVETRIHSKKDEVSFLDIDSEFRVISGGMDSIKVWDEEDEQESENEDFKGFDEESDMEAIEEAIQENKKQEKKEEKKEKREADSEEEEAPKLTKKQKRELEKKRKNIEKNANNNGIARFDDL